MATNKVVIKVGTSSLTLGGKRLSRRTMLALVQQVVQLHEQGVHVVIVSSGAVASGRELLGATSSCYSKQTAASVGQVRLMRVWEELFSIFDLQTEAEPIFTALAELSTRQIAESVDATGMSER